MGLAAGSLELIRVAFCQNIVSCFFSPIFPGTSKKFLDHMFHLQCVQPQDPIVSEIFSYVAEFWPVMTRKNSCDKDSQAQSAESSAPDEPSDGVVRHDDFNGEFADAMLLQLGLRDDGYPAHDMEDDLMNDSSAPIMAQPVEPPRDSQLLEDTYPYPMSLSPPKLDALECDGPCPSGPGSPEVGRYDGHSSPAPAPSPPQTDTVMKDTVVVDSYSPSIAPTELEVTPSPNPVHTSENQKVDLIEVPESPEPKKDPKKDVDYQQLRDRINVLKYLVRSFSCNLR